VCEPYFPRYDFAPLRQVNFLADGYVLLEHEEKADDSIADIQECPKIAEAAAQKAANS
jgi:hypothetical protein